METSTNSNSKHKKSTEESDDSEIDDIHQPAKRPRLRANESDSASISSDSNTTGSNENSQSRYTDFVSEVVSEKVGYNSDDDEDIVDHEAEKRPKSMPKKATNNAGPMGKEITNSVEEQPRKRNLSNSEPSQAEGQQNEEEKSTNGDTAKKPKLDDKESKDEKVSQEIMPVSMVAHVVGNLTNETVDEDKPLKPKAPVDDRCKKCIFLEMTCIHSETYMEKIRQMRRDRGIDTEEEEEVEDVVEEDPPGCDKCMDDEDSDCKFCGCRICAGKEEVDTLLVCEACEYFFHMKCLDPPLETIPEDDWFCSNEQCQKKQSETAILCSVSMVTHVVGNLQFDDFYNNLPVVKEKGKPGRPRKDENHIDEDGNFIKKGPIILDAGWGDEAIECKECNDDESKKCKFCGCRICGGKDEPETMLVCEFCEYYFHMKCLDPPLEAIPEDDWFCSNEQCQKKQDQTAIMQSVSMVTHVVGNLTFDNLVVDNMPESVDTMSVDNVLPAVTENGFVNNEQENKSNEQTKEE